MKNFNIITGMPRSGSTLLCNILSQNPAFHAGATSPLPEMVWLRDKDDFPGFNAVYAEYFPTDPPARSAVLSALLVDVRVEIEVVAYKPGS